MNVRTILVPIDFSACSAALVAHAASLARSLGAELRLLHVIQPPDGIGGRAVIQTAEGPRPVLDALVEEAEAALQHFDTAGVPALRGSRVGSPVEGILEAVDELAVDLVVIGTHGREGLAHLVLGSVAERVVRRSPVPVLTIRSKHHAACEARNCDWCASPSGPVRTQARFEADG